MWFFYHSPNGFPPRAIQAESRQAADAFIRYRYGDEAQGFVGQDSVSRPGYQQDTIAGAGTVPDTGPTGTGGGDVPPDVRADLDEGLRDSAFASGLRQRGFNTEGPLGGLLRAQAQPAYANFSLANAFRGGGSNAPDENAFSAYAANTGPNAYSNSLNLYRQASTSPFGAPSLSDALNRAGAADTDEQEAFRQNYMNVAQNAARARYSPAAAKFLPDRQTLNRQFNDQIYQDSLRGANARGVSLLDFLKRQYGF